jgi:serine/threonine protein kinase
MPICKQCGSPLPDQGDGQCARCLLQLACGTRTWGEHELLEIIGQGGMGQVYRARELAPPYRKVVALKRIRPGIFSPAVLRRFLVEAESAANLAHPNIVTIYRYGEYEGEPYYSMAFIEGESLRDRLPSIRRTPGEPASDRNAQRHFAAILAKVARAVDYAHRHGVLHRDLKPANIILDHTDEPHLLDFGLAKYFRGDHSDLVEGGPSPTADENRPVWPEDSGPDSASQSRIVGTLWYMSPEQTGLARDKAVPDSPDRHPDASKARSLTVATDIYSLGAILYHLLTGQPPLAGKVNNHKELEAYLQRVRAEPPLPPSQLNSSVDRILDSICLKCLQKRPEDRYASALALSRDLDNWRAGKPVTVVTSGIVGRTWLWCRREPLLTGLIAGIFVLLTSTTLLALRRETLALSMRSEISQVLRTRIKQEWQRDDSKGVGLSAEERYLLRGRPVPTHRPLKLTVGLSPEALAGNAEGFLERCFPLLDYLDDAACEERMLFDFFIFKHFSNAVSALAGNRVDLLCASPETSVSVLRAAPNLPVLARSVFDTGLAEGSVVFVRQDSAIQDLLMVKGKSVAFLPEDSFSGHTAAKLLLAEAGVRARELRLCTNLPRRNIIQSVRAGSVDVGVTTQSEVDQAMEQMKVLGSPIQLRILARVPGGNHYWIGSERLRNLGAKPIATVQRVLLEFKDRNILEGVYPGLVGFTNAAPDELPALEAALRKARLFDAP